MSVRPRGIATALIVIAAAACLTYLVLGGDGVRQLDESSFYDAVADGQVESVTLKPDGNGFAVRGRLKSEDGSNDRFSTYVLADRYLVRNLGEAGVAVTTEPLARWSVLSLVGPLIVLLILGTVFVVMLRGMRQEGDRLLSLRRSQARMSSAGTVTFEDVAGVEEAKQELREIVEFLEEPDRFQLLGGTIPTGALLTGPPGTGKTLLARAVAGEAGVPFFSVSGSDFVEMFVGIGASRVRDLFAQGRMNAPCIVFVDEIDAVGRRRGTGIGGGHDEREQTLNQLLVELDGFNSNDGVIVLAATNRPDVLDPALLRPGRFDRQIVVDRPDVFGREKIIRIHARKMPLAVDVALCLVARGTPGFSGAELANLVNEAALNAAGHGREAVSRVDFEHAKDKALMGSARRSLVIGDDERRAMAYHQAGHALLAHLLPDADPLHKVTIVPRGRALGTTQQLPTEDRHTASRRYLLATICGLMGGRAAEEQELNRLSSGAGEDFERATVLARKMVTEWGMSESLGPLAYGRAVEQVFLGKEIAQYRDFSEATATAIDREVRKIVMRCYDEARRILAQRAEALTRIAEALLTRETLVADQIAALERGEALEPTAEPDVAGGRQSEGAEAKRKAGRRLPVFPEPNFRPA